MSQIPKSLTAIVHVRFNTKDGETRSAENTEIEIVGRILDRASEMPLADQQMLMRFADYLKQFAQVPGGQRPS